MPYYDNIKKDVSANIENLMIQAKYEEDKGRIFIKDIDENQTWIY